MLFGYFNKVLVLLPVVLFTSSTYAAPLLWNAPPQNSHFIGRSEQLQEIEARLQNEKIAVLSGYSGLGKSQIAKEFTYRNGEKYQIVWWFYGNQYLEPQFHTFAELLNRRLKLGLEGKLESMSPERLVKTIFYELERRGLKCLFVYDDVKTVEPINDYLPSRLGSHILFTTQNANFAEKVIPVGSFERKESHAFLKNIFPDTSSQELDSFATHLHDNPSSLALASEYIRQYPGMTIHDYVTKHTNTVLRIGQRQRYGDPTDAYERDLLMATQLNVEALENNSHHAYNLLGFIAVSHLSGAHIDRIHNWMDLQNIPHQDVVKLLNHMKDYSLVNIDGDKVGMHELIQKIVTNLMPRTEKIQLIDEAVQLLLVDFSDRLDLISESMIKDSAPLLHVERISSLAAEEDYHSSDLALLRARAFDVFTCGVRDLEKAAVLQSQLEQDFVQGIKLSRKDEALYYISLSLFSAMNTSKCDAAIVHGEKALKLLDGLPDVQAEKLRMISNFIQYYSLTGELEECEKLLEQGETLLPHSEVPAYNALFILASTLYLMDKGETSEVMKLIQKNAGLLDRVTLYPTLKFYILNQLAEAQLKEGQHDACLSTLNESEQCASEFYKDEENSFFANLKSLRAAALSKKRSSPNKAEALFKDSLETFGRIFYEEDDFHRGQGLGNLLYGQFLSSERRYEEAKQAFQRSQTVFDVILKNKAIDDVSKLYTSLAILGMDLIEEELTQTYLKKHMSLFGADHPRTKLIMITLDQRGLNL